MEECGGEDGEYVEFPGAAGRWWGGGEDGREGFVRGEDEDWVEEAEDCPELLGLEA